LHYPLGRPLVLQIRGEAEGKCTAATVHRQVKYLNSVVEADHGKLMRLIKQTLCFKSVKAAYATLEASTS